MLRLNRKLALAGAAIAAVCVGAVAVYATGGSPGEPAGIEATATATPAAAGQPSSSTCGLAAGPCDDGVQEPELTCEEAHACADDAPPATTPGAPGGTCQNGVPIEACYADPRPGGPLPCAQKAGPGIDCVPSDPCIEIMPAPAPGRGDAPSVAGSVTPACVSPCSACMPPSCPTVEPLPVPPSGIAPMIARCATPPCTAPGAPTAPPANVPQTGAPSAVPGCPEPLPPDCAISSEGEISCPTPGASGSEEGSAPGATADAGTSGNPGGQ